MANRADVRANHAGLAEYLQIFSRASRGTFRATLVKENGQGYNLMLHADGAAKKVRIALVSLPEDVNCVVGSTREVRDIIEKHFAAGGQFPSEVERVVDQTLQGLLGCVQLEIKNGLIVGAEFHKGEISP